MLIKFLSYTASAIGTGRHKPILISLGLLLLSVTSVTVALSLYSGNPHSAASSVQQNEGGADQQGSDKSPGLGGLSKKDAKDSSQNQQNAQNPVQTPATNPNGNRGDDTEPANATFDFSLSTTALNLTPDSASGSVTANTSDSSSVSWSVVAPDNAEGVTASVVTGHETGPSTILRFYSEPYAIARTYQFKVFAKDSSRSINLSKTILVTIE